MSLLCGQYDLTETMCIHTFQRMPHSPTEHPLLTAAPLRLAQLVNTGRLSSDDARELLAARNGASDPGAIARALQAKHAAARVNAAVQAALLTEREGEAILQRLRAGEDPSFVPTMLRRRADGTSE
jgi:hypothetical protein